MLLNCGLVVSTHRYVSAYLCTWAVYMVDILGFVEAERNNYIQNACTGLKGNRNRLMNLSHITIGHATIRSLCFVPFNMVVLLYLYKKEIRYAS